MKRPALRIHPLVFVGFGLTVAADTALPHVSRVGDLISAVEMNENFAVLVEAINTLDATKQARVPEGCPPGSSIQSLDDGGGVVCHEDRIGGEGAAATSPRSEPATGSAGAASAAT